MANCFDSFSSCTNTSASGAIQRLLTYGTSDQSLKTSKGASPFVASHRRSTIFAVTYENQQAQQLGVGQAQTSNGSSLQYNMNRVPDLMSSVWLSYALPAITAQSGSPAFPLHPTSLNTEPLVEEYIHEDEFNSGNLSEDNLRALALARYEQDTYGACRTMDILAPEDAELRGREMSCEQPITSAADMYDGPVRMTASYCDAVGFALIAQAELKIGGQVIDSLTGVHIMLLQELMGRPGFAIGPSVGRFGSRLELLAASRAGFTTTVKIPFFCQNVSRTIPLTALQFHSVSITVHTRPFTQVCTVSDEESTVVRCHDNEQLRNGTPDSQLWVRMIYLDQEERDAISAIERTVPVLVHDSVSFRIGPNDTGVVQQELHLSLPTKCMLFVYQSDSALQHNVYTYFGCHGDRPPIKGIKMLCNNTVTFEHPAFVLENIVPEECFRCAPSVRHVLAYSFALAYDEEQHLGSFNLSRVDTCRIALDLCDHIQPGTFSVHSSKWNNLAISSGLAGLSYA